MGNQLYKDKVSILGLPAQSGKTRKAEDEITRLNLINQLHSNPTDLNLWISSNNQLLVSQTSSRFTKDLGATTLSWMCVANQSLSVKELAYDITTQPVDMIVMCANSIRMKYLAALIELLNINPTFNRKINLWFDEADKTCSLWSKYETKLGLSSIQFVVLVTATYESIVKQYGVMSIIPYEQTHPDCYRRLKDMNQIEEDLPKVSPVEYAAYILTKYPDLSQPGKRAFIPGSNKKESHEEISALLLSRGFAVMILNGTHKEIRIPGKELPPNMMDAFEQDDYGRYWRMDLTEYLTVSDPSKPPEEFNSNLSKIYYRNQLSRFPFAVTGYLCVERGITFQCHPQRVRGMYMHKGFLFDYGIVSNKSNAAEAYQTMARLFGNIGNPPSGCPPYKPCDIYSTWATFKRVEKQEEIAVHLARLAHEENRTEITSGDLRRAAAWEDEKEWDLFCEEFKDRDEANVFLKQHNCRQNNKEKVDPSDERFLMSSTTKSLKRLLYDEVKSEIEGWSKLSGFDVRESNQYGRMFICYRDLNDPESIVFIVRVLAKNTY
jgi:hypothetical protein